MLSLSSVDVCAGSGVGFGRFHPEGAVEALGLQMLAPNGLKVPTGSGVCPLLVLPLVSGVMNELSSDSWSMGLFPAPPQIFMREDQPLLALLVSVFHSPASYSIIVNIYELSHDKTNKMTVPPVKTHSSLGIRPVWSQSSLCAQWVAKDPSFLHADSED